MTTTTTGFAEAVTTHIDAVNAAESFVDKDLTREAASRKRAEMHRDAQAALAARIEALPVPGDDPRPAALEGMRAMGADQIAAEGRDLSIVRELLDSGRRLDRIIANADRTRLGAILAHREVIALASLDPEAAATEIEQAVFDRLEAMGVPEVVAAADRVSEWRATAARGDLLRELQQGAVSLGTLQSLRRAAPDEYEAILPIHDAQEVLLRSVRAVRHLSLDVSR